LVKLIMCSDIPGHWVDVWRSGKFPEKRQESVLLIANMDHRTTERSTSDSLGNVSWFRIPLYSCTEGMCHSFTHPGTSLHVTQFTRPSPALVVQATSAGVRRPGYEANHAAHTSKVQAYYYKV